MKMINGLVTTALFIAATSSVSAASVEHETVVIGKALDISNRQASFQHIVARHVDRVIEAQLQRQGELVVASMYEAPTLVPPVEVEIEQHL